MKRIFLFFIGILSKVLLFSQGIGIGKDVFIPDSSAILEVRATDKGILIPRVTLERSTNSTPIVHPAVGLLVFNEALQNDVKPGFYYWDGLQWRRIFDDDKNIWKLTGNEGINPMVNYIGTTDSAALSFRTSGLERLRIDENGNVGVGTSSPAQKLHVEGGVRIVDLRSLAYRQVVLADTNGDLSLAGKGSVGDVLTWTDTGVAWTMPEMHVVATVWGAIAATAAKTTNSAILISPIYIPARITVNQMKVRVTTVLGAPGDVGVYDDQGRLVLNGGSNSLTTAAGLKTIVPQQAKRVLNPGQYYVAATWNSTTGVIAGANFGVAGTISRSGYISTGGGSVLPPTIDLNSIVNTQYLYFFSLNN